ncbi:transglycosylase SLT domain-containing protein [Aestuariibius sp. 2305UL40-4]|uniref:transglycosylase SLT domain-containing protein n=1 Tax=Aestuariibius violaceus TaxID=3234132 RepID=UPI00345E78BB
MRGIRAGLAALLLLTGCAAVDDDADEMSFMTTLPPMAWDHRPEAPVWTSAALMAMENHGTGLISTVPSDVERWCPNYPEATAPERAAFWVGLLSALAEHESTWNPRAVGGGGRWFGLVQIAPATARGYGCRATNGEALKDGQANLSCAIRIASAQVQRRGSVARGMLDWGPFHSGSKRAEMRAFTQSQPYCTG